MASRWTLRIACALALVFVILATECGVAQEPPQTALPQTTPPQTTNDALHAMSRLAGVIFTGQVIAVRRMEGANGATGVVEIEFAVEDAVRGVSGSTYTLREWAGLWPAGDEPFRVDQRFLMLLHAPGAAGLSSPVGGMDGAIPIRGSMQTQATGSVETGSGGAGSVETGSTETTSARIVAEKALATGTSTLADGRVADLRWVGTRVIQPLSYRTTPVVHTTALPVSVSADALNAGPAEAVGPESASGLQTTHVGVSDVGASVAPIDATPASASQGTPYTTVLAMLRCWEKADDATR